MFTLLSRTFINCLFCLNLTTEDSRIKPCSVHSSAVHKCGASERLQLIMASKKMAGWCLGYEEIGSLSLISFLQNVFTSATHWYLNVISKTHVEQLSVKNQTVSEIYIYIYICILHTNPNIHVFRNVVLRFKWKWM